MYSIAQSDRLTIILRLLLYYVLYVLTVLYNIWHSRYMMNERLTYRELISTVEENNRRDFVEMKAEWDRVEDELEVERNRFRPQASN